MKPKLPTLFDRKLPADRSRDALRSALLPMLSVGECVASRDLFTQVDEQGDWFSTTWQPFLRDAGGTLTVAEGAALVTEAEGILGSLACGA